MAGRAFGMSPAAAFLLGLALAATSVSISARTLMELGVLRSRVGLSLLGAAVVDDILSILAFSIFLAVYSGNGGVAGLLWLTLRMFLFLAAGTAFGLWALPRLARWVERLSISQGPLVFAIVMLLFYGLAAELVGQMAAIIGTFLAGLMFARTPEKDIIEQGVSTLAYGLFVPIFFVNIGLSVDLRNLPLYSIWLILVVAVAAIAGKLLGAAAGARLGGLPHHEAIQLGTGMVARGEVTLIIAAMGNNSGLISGSAFSAIVVVVLVSTLVTPPMLHAAISRLKPKQPVRNRRGSEREMKLILFVLHDAEKLNELLDAWKDAGVSGATVLFSTGLGRIHQSMALRDDLPLMPSLEDFLPKPEHLSRTIFTMIEDEAVVEKVVAATQQVVGDLCEPDRGLLMVLPVSQVYGLRKPNNEPPA